VERIEVVDYDKLYANSASRNVENLTWVPIPINQDGSAFKYIVSIKHEDGFGANGAEILGAWLVILQRSSMQPQRGLLVDKKGRLLGAKWLGVLTGFEERVIKTALKVLSSPEINWLKIESVGGSLAPNDQSVGGSLAPNDQSVGGSLAPNDQSVGGQRSPCIYKDNIHETHDKRHEDMKTKDKGKSVLPATKKEKSQDGGLPPKPPTQTLKKQSALQFSKSNAIEIKDLETNLIKLTQAEFNALKTQYPEDFIGMLKLLENWMLTDSKNEKRYKTTHHIRCIKNWVIEKYLEKKQTGGMKLSLREADHALAARNSMTIADALTRKRALAKEGKNGQGE
jgi:hypothetical protein